MSKRNVLIKVGVVTTSLLLGTVLTASKIAFLPANKAGISNALGQKDFAVVGGGDANYYESKFNSVKELMDAGKQLVRDIEAEGAVLLKNNNALPLTEGTKINLIGVASRNSAFGGRGSAQQGGKSDAPITLLEGLKNAVNANGKNPNYSIDEALLNSYQNDDAWSSDRSNMIKNNGGVVIYTLSRTGGEGSDFSTGGEKGDKLALTAHEEATLKGLKALKDEGSINKIIILLNVSNQIADFLSNPEYGVDGALWIGNPGLTGMAAVGDLIAGGVNPSGHLSDMHWYNHNDNPVSKNFDAYKYKNGTDYNLPQLSATELQPKYGTYDVYQEGMYLGYRYAETRYYDVVTGRENVGTFNYSDVVAHPFGFGGSYTDFEFSNYKVKENDKTYTVSVDVKNIGETYSGKDAVQIYVQKPYNQKNIERGIEVPAVELVGFGKTKLLAPNEKDTVTVEVEKSKFAVYDAHTEKTYIQNDGEYFLTAAKDSHDAVNNILAAKGINKSNNSKMTDNGNKDLVKKFELEYDNETFSVSATGKKITNLFDAADINKFKGKGTNKVTYLSRNDWNKTFPTKNVELKMTQGICDSLLEQDDLSRIEPDNTPYPTYGAQNNLKLSDMIHDEEGNPLDYNDPKWDLFLDQLTFDETAKLLSDGLRQTVALPSVGKPGTVDHNGPAGLTQSYGESSRGLAAMNNDPDKAKRAPYYPCAGIIAATFNPELATKFGDMLGEDALWAGYNGLYGVAINTHRSPYEGRAFEYFSEDPFLAGTMAALESAALQSHGCNAYIKHFALNEQENIRQGVQIWLNEQTLREIYLKPFEMAVVDGGANNAMASFTRIGTQFNPACKELMTDFLRGECGMKGLVVTDMYDIGYEPQHLPTFILAGCDLPDGSVPGQYDAFKTGYGNFAMAMRESAKRILYSTSVSNAMNGGGEIVPVTPLWVKLTYTADIVLGVLWLGMIGTAVYFAIDNKKKRNITK